MRLAPATSQSQATYYLNIASGDKDFPETAVFTVQSNEYDVFTTFFKEEVNTQGAIVVSQVCALWNFPDLEYYPPTVDLTRNNKMTVLPCNQQAEPVSLGAEGAWKYWFPGYVNYSDRPEPTFKWDWVPVWEYDY